MQRLVRVIITRTAGTARILHRILDVLRFLTALSEGSGGAVGVGGSEEYICGGRGEGGGVNI